MTKLKAALLILAVVAAATLLLAARSSEDTIPVTARSLIRTAELRGELVAADSLRFGAPAQVQSQWNFKVAYLAPEGEEIAEGQPLVGFDTTELQMRLIEALSKLETAEANLEKKLTSTELEREDRDLALAEARAEADRAQLKAEAPQDLVASKDLEQARIDLQTARQRYQHLSDKAKTQTEQADSQLRNLRNLVQRSRNWVDRLQNEIDAMTVKAPSPGTVVYVTNWRGEKVKIGDQTHRMRKIVSLPDLNRLRATAKIDEVYSAELQIGQQVSFKLDAFPEELFEGKIRGINPAVQRRSRRDPRMAVTVDIELTNPDPDRMRPGMRIEGHLEIQRTEPVPAIPISSVLWVDGRPAVTTAGWFGSRTVQVELGRRDEEWVEVTDGLRVDDRVILATTASVGAMP